MPVTTTRPPTPDTSRHAGLRDALAAELVRPKPFGQPDVLEEVLPRSDFFSVTVIWGAWDGVPDVDRPELIIAAYRAAQPDRAEYVAYALGFTTSEAHRSGLLPHWITLSDQPGRDPARVGKYLAALTDLGATTRHGGGFPVVRLRTHDLAVAYRNELLKRFPGTESEWLWGQEMRIGSVTEAGVRVAY